MPITEEFVIQTDQTLIEQDVPLHARPFGVVMAWMKVTNVGGDLLSPALWNPVKAIYQKLYPSGDFSMPAMLIGGVALRDRFYPARVNVGFGTINIDPVKCIEIPPQELRVIWQQRPDQVWRAIYAVADLWDFAYGVNDLRSAKPEACVLWANAQSAIASTARTLTATQDHDAAVQSACLAAELSMKGVLAHLGWDEPRYRKLSHHLPELAQAIINERPSSGDAHLKAAADQFPDYVKTRYGPHGLTRVQLMGLAMRSQFVAAEALRRVSDRNLAGQIEHGPDAVPRRDF